MLKHSSMRIVALEIILQTCSCFILPLDLDGRCPEKNVVELEDEKWVIEELKGRI